MALALLIHVLALVVLGLGGGRLYYKSVSEGFSSPRVMRWVGVALLVAMTIGVWGRLWLTKGVPPASFTMSSTTERYLALSAVGLASLVLAWGWVLRAGRFFLSAIRFRVKRAASLQEIRLRDDERGDTTLSGVPYTDLEAQLDELCRDHAGARSRVQFQFLNPLASPILVGFLSPRVVCPLDMARSEGAQVLELAALREVELLKLKVIPWRVAMLLLLLLNPLGAFFASGVLLTLEFDADEAASALGDEARDELKTLLAYLVRSAGAGRSEGLLDPGPRALQLRLARLEPRKRGLGTVQVASSAGMVALWGLALVRLGPVSLDDVGATVFLKPPAYIVVGRPIPGFEARAITDAGWAGGGTTPLVLRDGVSVDARDCAEGYSILGIRAAAFDEAMDACTIRIEVVPGPRPTRAQPMLHLALISYNRATGGSISDMTIHHLRFEALRTGVQDVVIPFSDKTQKLGVDNEIYLPAGWKLFITNLRPSKELPEVTPETERAAAERVKALIAYEDQWSSRRLGLAQALDWSPANLEKQEKK